MKGKKEMDIGMTRKHTVSALPQDFVPHAVEHFDVRRIILSKGSLDTPERAVFVRRICEVYPNATIQEQLGHAHNHVSLGEGSRSTRIQNGKKTLVFGELKSAVRSSSGESNTCPSHWSFSVYGFCPYGCKYCYLPGTQTFWFSPAVRVYVNLPEILAQIDRVANRSRKPTAFILGKLQDGLALDPLTAYSTTLVPFFAGHKYARQIIMTKSDSVERFLDLEHGGNTILSWSLNPPEIAARYEKNAPCIEARIEAMKQCADVGYPTRATIMPFVPCGNWRAAYTGLVQSLLSQVRLQRLTLGGICMSPRALSAMRERASGEDGVSDILAKERHFEGGRIWYDHRLCTEVFEFIAATARAAQPDLPISSCHTL